MRRKLTTVLVGLILSATILSSCGSQAASFCDSARSFEKAVRELDVNELASSLDEKFWSSLLDTMDELIASEQGRIRTELETLRSQLASVVDRLEKVDYNLIRAALDPETATSYLAIAAALVLFVADSLQNEIKANC
jgi:hypothetical protein